MKPYRSELSDLHGTSVDFTVNSGQVFLWKRDEGFWYGIDGQNVLKCNSNRIVKSYSPDRRDFFRDAENHKKIARSISKDTIIRRAVAQYPGLRLPRQDPFQCCISFIASSNSNIQKIRTSLEKICREFGKRVRFDGRQFFLFPEPADMAHADVERIHRCGLGYRSEYVKRASAIVMDGAVDFEELRADDYYSAKEKLCSIPGVGNKVADCILLFSLDKYEAFPLDRWVLKILQRHYQGMFDVGTGHITDKQYDILHEKIVRYFGPYAGYAQQLLFKMEREDNGKGWL